MQLFAEWVEADGLFIVGHGIGVVRESVVGDATIMIGSHIKRMYLEGACEIVDGTAVVARTEFCYSAEEISLEIVRFRDGRDIEIVYRLGIVLLRKLHLTHKDVVLMVNLCAHLRQGNEKEKQYDDKLFQGYFWYFMNASMIAS